MVSFLFKRGHLFRPTYLLKLSNFPIFANLAN